MGEAAVLTYFSVHPSLPVPAASMPVAPQVGSVVGHHDDVEGPRRDDRFASWAHVRLAGRIGLDGDDRYFEVAPARHLFNPRRGPRPPKPT